MDKQLPVYSLFIDDDIETDLEVNYVALVSKPAIEKNFLAFKDAKPLTFSVDEEKRTIIGPAMLADFPIYRRDDEYGEYIVEFNKESILSIVKKFFAKGYNQNFNLSHDPEKIIEGVSIFQSFITNEALGIKPLTGYEDAKEGSWFMGAYVTNDDVWKDIKEGKFKGFSVEGMFRYKKVEMSKEERIYNQVKEILSSL